MIRALIMQNGFLGGKEGEREGEGEGDGECGTGAKASQFCKFSPLPSIPFHSNPIPSPVHFVVHPASIAISPGKTGWPLGKRDSGQGGRQRE